MYGSILVCVDNTLVQSLIGLDSFRAIYEGLLKVLNDPNEFPPDKTTIFIAQNGPMLQERGLEKISGFSDINLNDLLRRGKIGDKVEGEDRKWAKLSKSDVAKHASVEMIQRILFNEKGYDSSIDDKHAFEKFYKDNVKGQISQEFISKIKVIISRDYGISMKELSKLDNFIFNILDNNIKSYYGTYLDDSGKVKFGLVIDGSIQSFLPSKKSFLLSDIPYDIIERSNLEEELDYKEGKLIGCFVLGFKFENGGPIYRLFKVDRSINLENGWQLGYVNPDTNEIHQIFITDANSRKLYGRFVFENKDVKDYGKDRINNMIDWWRNEELNNLIKGNYLTEGDRRYGIKLVSSIMTRYGNTYQITTIKVNVISPHLQFGINYDYYETMWESFKGAHRSRKGKLSEVMFLNYYKVSDEIKAEAQANLDEIYQLVKRIINIKQWPEELYIRNGLIRILNARLEGGVVILGQNKKEIGKLFERFLGDLTGIENERNHLLYKVCFNDVRADKIPFTVGQLIIREQTMEQWDRAILDMFKRYTPDPNGDRIDRVIIASGITQDTSFSENYEENPTENDLKLLDTLKGLVISIFGRYTYEAMITGSIFAKDGHVRFIGHPWQTFSSTAKSNGLIFAHTGIPSTSLSKMKARGTLYRAESILLNMFTIGMQRKLLIGPDLETDFKIFDMPTIPMEKWMPIYRETTEVNPDDLESFLDLLSYYSAQKVGINDPYREVETWNPRAPGNMKLFNGLYSLFEIRINNKNDLSDKQKAMYKLMVLESINFLVFASTASTDVRMRVNLKEFLQSEGRKEFTFKIKAWGFPSDLKEIKFNEKIFEFFKNNYRESEIKEIIDSLDPAGVHPKPLLSGRKSAYRGVIEYYTENILRAQIEEIYNFGNWLKNLAKNRRIEIRPFNTYAKGFAYSTRKIGEVRQNLPYFPDPLNTPGYDQRYVLDGRNINNIRFENINDYKKILGGLLVDHQTFVISEIDENGNIVKNLCAFNLLQGALDLDPNSELGLYVTLDTTLNYQGAPKITEFDETLYNKNNLNNIINIMKALKENNGLIGYQRVQDKNQEMITWITITSRLSGIKSSF